VVAPEANGLPYALALAYAGLGQKEKALAQAEQAVKDYETDAVNKPSALATRARKSRLVSAITTQQSLFCHSFFRCQPA
jgi:hypothetical protein